MQTDEFLMLNLITVPGLKLLGFEPFNRKHTNFLTNSICYYIKYIIKFTYDDGGHFRRSKDADLGSGSHIKSTV